MGKKLPVGPYKMVQTSHDGDPAPWYIIPFDKNGVCTAPLTRADLIESVQSKTDVFLFSHGWNNDWDTASARYEDFIGGFVKMRTDFGLAPPAGYRPLLAGVFWPSTALVMPWERAPKFAGAPAATDDETEAWRLEIEDVAADLDEADRPAFYALAQQPKLSAADAKKLAEILAKAVGRFDAADKEVGSPAEPAPTADQLLERARALPKGPGNDTAPGSFGFATGGGGAPQAAFSLSDLDPRNLVRLTTVLKMKDRAARVGANGVGALLVDILKKHPGVRIHLVGHSYGAIVVLSAVCHPQELPAPVASMLLLQPAVSQWCFAGDVAGEGFPGGYHAALERVKGRIFTTFTKHDAPLTKFFHLAARRTRDFGQVRIAGAPSPYAALGGFGPAGLSKSQLQTLPLTTPPTPLALNGAKVCALNGDSAITGHGDISVLATWWALFQQLA